MREIQRHYSLQLKASEYDFLEVVRDSESGSITVKFLDTRWRTVSETIKLLEEIIEALKDFQK